MQASQPSNETRLPRAVLRKSASIEARRATRAEPETDPAAPTATPAQPAAAAADPSAASPTPTPLAPPADPRHSDPEYWKHRFDAASGRLAAQSAEHREAIAALRQKIAELEEQVRLSASPSTPTEVNLSEFFTPEQIKELGEDDAKTIAQAAMKAALKTAQDAVNAELEPLRAERKASAEDQAKQRVQQFEEKLEERVPNYREIDKDAGWLAWLAELNEDDEQRQAVLDRHCAAFNAPAVAKMFETYLKTKQRPAPPVAPAGTGAAPSGDPPAASATVAGQGYPTKVEMKDFFTRSAIKKPGQFGYVTDKERAEFEARLKLPRR